MKYLFGELSEEEEGRLEEKYFAEDDLHDHLQSVELELIDRYVNDELSKQEQEKFEKRFLSMPERLQEIEFARALKAYRFRETAPVSSGRSKSFQWPRPWPHSMQAPAWIAAVIILIGSGVLIWRLTLDQSQVKQGMAALKNAYQRERPLEARISDFDYAPWASNRGSQVTLDKKYHDLAANLLLNAVTEKPTPEAHHSMGRFYLANKRFEEAIDEFNAALKSDPANAQVHSDLGVAFLEKGKRDRNAEDFARCLDYLDESLKIKPSFLEPLFNRALVLQQMGLYPRAEQAWENYIEKDPSSQWAGEAKRNLDLINEGKNKASQNNQQFLQEFLQAYMARDDTKAWDALNACRELTGNYIVSELMDSYLRSSLSGNAEEARVNLQALFYAGEMELSRSGDRFMLALARFYGSLKPGQLHVAAQARELLNEGNSLSSKSNRFSEAAEKYQSCLQLFKQIGDVPDSMFVEHRLGHCYLRQSKPSRGLLVFQRLYPFYEKESYRRLLAQSLYFLADAHTGFGEYSRAIDYNSQALELYDKLGDKKGMLKVLVQLGEEYRFLGSYKKALSFLQRGLDLANETIAGASDIWGLYFVIAPTCGALGLNHASLEYYREVLRLALEIGSPLYISRSYAEIALLYAKLNNQSEAIQNAEYAYQIGENISGESIGLNIMAFSSLQLGHIYRLAGDFDKALLTYDKVLELYNRLDFSAYQYEAHKAKFLTYFAQGDNSSAKEELQTAIQLLEQYRSKIYEESNTNSFFELENSLYDLAIDFEYSRMNAPEKALFYAELGRSRSLFDMNQRGVEVINNRQQVELRIPSDSQPHHNSEIKDRVPNQSQIVQYSVLSDKTIIWVITKGKVEHRESKIDSSLLQEKVARYLEQVNKTPAEPDQKMQDYAMELYDILISPVESLLDSDSLLCIVPDKFLNYLCYEALISPITHKELIRTFIVVSSPSSNLFIEASEEAEKKADNRIEKLLSVGNPRFDPKVFRLADLSSARREARRIASYYQSRTVLVENDATEDSVKSEMQQSDVIHLAMHYVVEKQSALLSSFILAQERGRNHEDSNSDGVMQVYEIYRLNLSRARLIVLSACETGIEQYYMGEGAIGAVRPFLVAKVPLIVCSLWPVNSDSTEELMTNFHKYRKQGDHPLSTIKALRQAKLDLLDGSAERFRHPYYWASFVAVGGNASF